MEKTVTNTVRGVEMKLAAHTRSLELCARMNYETENLDFIDEIPAGNILYDLGACEGRFSIYAALKGVRCFSFEPEKNNFSALTENIALNHLDETSLRTFKIAIAEKSGQAKLKIGQPWAGGHQKVVEQQDVRQDLAFNFVDEEIVEAESIDSAIAKFGLPKPDFLKIDIDGSEVPFLKGAVQTLSHPGLKKIIFELETTDKNFDWILNDLKGYGFTEENRYQVPNESNLFNIIFAKK